MIYDSLEALPFYRPLSDSIVFIERMVDGAMESHPAIERQGGAVVPRSYDGRLVAHHEQLCFHWVKTGREVIAVGYSEQAKAALPAADGTIALEGAQVATVVTLEAGEFVLLMPGEPYALGLSGSSESTESESLRFV